MSKYKVGDELRIRVWDDMEAEFGLNKNGNINCLLHFTQSMRDHCGKNFTVSEIVRVNSEIDCYRSEERVCNGFNVSSDMLEPRKEEPLYAASDTEINKLLGAV